MLDEQISWNDHIKTVESKLAKNIGLLNHASYFLNDLSLKTIYFSYIHSYLNYANIAWASTYARKLKNKFVQKRAVCFVFNEDRLSYSRPLLRKINAVNVYQINLYQHLNFMHKVNNQETPGILNDLIKRPVHKYPTNFSKLIFCLKNVSLNSKRNSISFRGPKLWNEILHEEGKEFESYSLFQNKIKSKLLMIQNKKICISGIIATLF